MSTFSPVTLNGYKFTDHDLLKEVITRFKNTTNILRTSFDRDKSFQMNVVYRNQIEKIVKQYGYVTKKYYYYFFCGLPGENFFLAPGQTETNNFFSLALQKMFLFYDDNFYSSELINQNPKTILTELY